MKDEIKNQIVKNAEPTEKAETRKREKKYAKLEVVYHAPLEAMAAVCLTFPGKASGVCGTAFS